MKQLQQEPTITEIQNTHAKHHWTKGHTHTHTHTHTQKYIHTHTHTHTHRNTNSSMKILLCFRTFTVTSGINGT